MDKVITVVIPTYNRKRLTDRAVASVKSRQPDLVEIIVVDDYGSEPYSYAARSNPDGILVHVIRRDSNGGAGLARKDGVSAAKGELIAFLDSDDEFGAAWMDALVQGHLSQPEYVRVAAVYIGRVNGGKYSYYLTWQLVRNLPDGLRLLISRIILTVLSNIFYTPSIAISKSICQFNDKLRHCEDYYTLLVAIFKAKRLTMPAELACNIGRAPNSSGGISSAKMEMFRGEMIVRMGILKTDYVTLPYKIIVPFGMVYQLLRSLIKSVFMRLLTMV